MNPYFIGHNYIIMINLNIIIIINYFIIKEGIIFLNFHVIQIINIINLYLLN